METIKVLCQGQGVKLQGALTFATVMPAWQALQPLFGQTDGREIVLDLAGVGHCDSAGLALLLACLRLADQRHNTLQFCGLTPQMSQLAKVSGLDVLLPILRECPL